MPANDTYWYNLKKMHVVFALSAVGLFAVTLGMMWADHSDEWRYECGAQFEPVDHVQRAGQRHR